MSDVPPTIGIAGTGGRLRSSGGGFEEIFSAAPRRGISVDGTDAGGEFAGILAVVEGTSVSPLCSGGGFAEMSSSTVEGGESIDGSVEGSGVGATFATEEGTSPEECWAGDRLES